MTAEIVNIKIVFEGWLQLKSATVRFEDGQTVERLIEDHGHAVSVLPYDPARRMAILVRQFRAPVQTSRGGADLLEAIAGLLEDETSADAAAREAFEETGLRLKDLEHVAAVWTMPGISTERMALFLARYTQSDRVGQGGGHSSESEHITVVEMPLFQLAALADSGRLEDMKTLALVQTLRLREPDLFQ